ncbi:hypothetical protein D9757_002597 [Collybiopsis confluens]|uniref:Uncharacterized protein n=1 Tax=Collybiopsis confluens TaxID=2823264 RepID=A0A8H5MDZ3_9AGAR|nr:hypothetical protein D9757_002597 [Collybiopsis confluens]
MFELLQLSRDPGALRYAYALIEMAWPKPSNCSPITFRRSTVGTMSFKNRPTDFSPRRLFVSQNINQALSRVKSGTQMLSNSSFVDMRSVSDVFSFSTAFLVRNSG